MSIPTILPLLSAIFVFLLGVLVLLKNRRSKLNALFTLLCLSLILWFFGTFMMFGSKEDAQAIFWDRFVYAGVVFIPILMYHFSLVFSKTKNKKSLLAGYILSLIFLFLSRTDYFVSGLYRYSWGYHTQARFFHHIFLIFFSVYLALFFINIYKYYRKVEILIERIQAKYIFLAFLVLLTGSIAYLPAYGIDVYPSAYVSGLIFAIILAYAILKHHLMNIRVIATEFFVGLIAIVLFIELLFSKSFGEILLRAVILFAFSFLGWSLIKSVIKEISRRLELEVLTEKLEKAYRDLKRLDMAKSEFISIASHQLRTPLTAIKGYISMILEKTYGKVPEKINNVLKNVGLSNERLIKLVNDLLSISRIESGKMEIKMENLQVEDIISSVTEELKNIIKEKNLYLKFEKPKTPLPRIMIDGDKIRQVILNLTDNAIKYTNQGGITVHVRKLKTELQIIISDTGEGLTRGEIAKMFESFSRGSAGTRLYTEGAGLGLYVAKKFVEMHKGKIWVKSEGRGKGSAFYIELPIG